MEISPYPHSWRNRTALSFKGVYDEAYGRSYPSPLTTDTISTLNAFFPGLFSMHYADYDVTNRYLQVFQPLTNDGRRPYGKFHDVRATDDRKPISVESTAICGTIDADSISFVNYSTSWYYSTEKYKLGLNSQNKAAVLLHRTPGPGSREDENEQILSVFPNPASFQVNLTQTFNQPVKWELYTSLGQIGDRQVKEPSVSHIQLPPDLTSGLYFYRLTHKDALYGGKLLIQRR